MNQKLKILIISLVIVTAGLIYYFSKDKFERTSQSGQQTNVHQVKGNISPGGGSSASEMILIPGGEIELGMDEPGNPSNIKMNLQPYYIDKYPVTIKEYWKYVTANKIEQEQDASLRQLAEKSEFANYPVILVSYKDAEGYARWVGKRLPVEAEWQMAAQGSDNRVYPWGNEIDLKKLQLKPEGWSEVGSNPQNISSYGVYDMAGNVFHWTQSYWKRAELQNMPGVEFTGETLVVKAGGWPMMQTWNTCKFRTHIKNDIRCYFLGFRCVKPKSQDDPNIRTEKETAGTCQPQKYMEDEAIRQVFSYELKPDRQLPPTVEKYIKQIKQGSALADVGCGLGYLTFILSKQTGNSGKVYAIDIQKPVVDFVEVYAKNFGLSNIVGIHSDLDNVKLPENSCDVIFLLGTISYINESQIENFANSLYNGLKQGGTIALSDEAKNERTQANTDYLLKHGFELVYEETEKQGFERLALFRVLRKK
jgi:iron(II)-dependent oxidoreductase